MYGLGRTDVVAATKHGLFVAFGVVSGGIVVSITIETNAGGTVSMTMAAANIIIESAKTVVAVPDSALTEPAIAPTLPAAGFLIASVIAVDGVMHANFCAVSHHYSCFWLPFQRCSASPSNNFSFTIGTVVARHTPHVGQYS